MTESLFYIYEHWRPDKGCCFYVGKGCGGRATNMFHRNRHHKAIQTKLGRLGATVEVRIIAHGLMEEDALSLEKERIAFWRTAGAKLANLTDGGEGISGYAHSDETKKKIGAASKGNKHGLSPSPETRAKMRAAKLGRKQPPELVAKRAAALIGNKSRTGQKISLESRAKQSAALKGIVKTPEWRAKLSASLKGRPHSPERRANIIAGKLRALEKRRISETAT